MSAPIDPPPWLSTVVEPSRVMTGDWTRWMSVFWLRVRSAAALVGTAVSLSNQSATIATKTAHTVVQTGLYRVSTYLRVTVADGVASSTTLTLTWREGSQTVTKAFPVVNGDTVTTVESQSLLVGADSGTVITYAIAYTSTTPAKMRYRFSLTVEQVV